jgi:disulfide oxidoreductase YuzD
VKNQLEDKDENQKEDVIEKIEKGKYDKNLVEEDSIIREGQLQDTKLWRKLQKYVESGAFKL